LSFFFFHEVYHFNLFGKYPVLASGFELTVVRELRDISCEGKGETIPLQAWTGPEGYRSLRLPDFKTVGT